MNTRSYQQCNRCVMDTSDQFITFDEKGNCNHCNEYNKKIASEKHLDKSSQGSLDEVIKKIKKKGVNKTYDCVLGVSGGVDSCYTAIVLKQLGLRVLAVHMDNGWNSEIAVKNIKNLVNKLGIDYQSYVLDWEEFKDLQLAFLKASVPEAETPTDIAIQGALHKVAAENGIKYIISGGNFSTEGILPKSWHYNPKDTKYLKGIHKQFGTVKLRSFPTFGYAKEIYYKFIQGIKIIYLLSYINFTKKEAQDLLEKEYGWKYYGGKHYESKYTGFLQSYILPEKFNIDYRRATFSSQICAGEITREYALNELMKKSWEPAKVEEEEIYICKKLGISLPEFKEIMAAPPKSHRDYPNDEKLLEFIYGLYRKNFRKES